MYPATGYEVQAFVCAMGARGGSTGGKVEMAFPVWPIFDSPGATHDKKCFFMVVRRSVV